MKLRVVYHLTFWSFFAFLFLLQNPTSNLQDYIDWFKILGVCAVTGYINLYFLLPKFFFLKKYLIYIILLFFLLGLGAFTLKLSLSTSNTSYTASIFQHFINLFFFILITSSLKFLREFVRRQELLTKLENKHLKIEISLLKSQINSHFLFNTLNNLYGLIMQNENGKAAEITLKLSDLMRYLLENSKIETISLQKEVKFLEDYITLEKIRVSQKSDIHFEIAVIDKDFFLAPLLFIPIVENAFKHGLNVISEKKFAHFSLAVQKNELFFEAQNSVGMSLSKQDKSGTGLDNLRKRLQLIYPDRHQLEIEKTTTFFKVTLYLQL
jgi:sensor histidine kinase YesM